MHKFFIGFFVAVFVCSFMLTCGGVAEAGVLDCVAVPPAQLVAKPLWDIAMLVIVVISLFL